MALIPLKGSVKPSEVRAALVAIAEHLANGRHQLNQLRRESHHYTAEGAAIVLKQIDAQLVLAGAALQAAFRRASAGETTPGTGNDARK